MLFVTTAPLLRLHNVMPWPKMPQFAPLLIAVVTLLIISWRLKHHQPNRSTSPATYNDTTKPNLNAPCHDTLRLQRLQARQQQAENHLQDARRQVFRIRAQINQVEQHKTNSQPDHSQLINLKQSLSEALEQLELAHQQQLKTMQKVQDAKLKNQATKHYSHCSVRRK